MRGSALLRLALSPLVLVAIVLVAMLLPELTGVDSARSVLAVRYADADPDPRVIAAIRADLGLDRPLWQRLVERLGRLCTGRFGTSWVSGDPVGAQLGRAFQVSLSIMVTALVVSFAVGCAAGLLAARRPGAVADRVVSACNRLASAVPEFALAPVLVAVFAVGLHLLPSSGWRGPANLVLPVASLVPVLAAPVAAVVRTQAAALRGENFVAAARARGIGEFRLWTRHIARPALPAALSLVTYKAAGMIAGTAAVETVFDIPGLGRTVVDAVRAQDIPVVQAGLVVAAAVALFVGAVGDALHLVVDPRSRGGAA
ncbi:ABC transporter permease [Saccharopolyspora rosea]|uniref:ABC transporter permease n=1 Tax=Saccharopolyspora rosea TaxID=524884 RepID=A0ABW3G1Z2_9PSEU|nr:ABC transporter permease [Saccharopolyspora rosea]